MYRAVLYHPCMIRQIPTLKIYFQATLRMGRHVDMKEKKRNVNKVLHEVCIHLNFILYY